MIKVILFDTDGVIIRKNKVFSERISEKLNIPIDNILHFFKNEFQSCLIGKADLKEEILKYLSIWGYIGTVDELLSFWFEGESDINGNVINYVQNLRKNNIKCFLHTNNEKYRTEYILKKLQLNIKFDGMSSSAKLGCKKPDFQFWSKIYNKLKDIDKSETFVWDDDIKNVESAKSFGFSADLFTTYNYFKNKTNKIAR